MLININPGAANMMVHVLKHAGWARATGPDDYYWKIQLRFDALEPVLHIPGEHSLEVLKWFRREAEVAEVPFNKWNWEDLIHAMERWERVREDFHNAS